MKARRAGRLDLEEGRRQRQVAHCWRRVGGGAAGPPPTRSLVPDSDQCLRFRRCCRPRLVGRRPGERVVAGHAVPGAGKRRLG